MKNFYLQLKKLRILLLFSVISLALVNPLSASHFVGSDISYQCTSTPGIYKVSLKLYRDCAGIQLCPGCSNAIPNGTTAGCTAGGFQTAITGASPLCLGTNFGSFTLAAVSVTSGYDIIQTCTSVRTICTNCNTRTAGTYSPGIEVYVFEGNVNLNVLPPTCCNVTLSYSDCCRNSALTTMQTGQFFSQTTINRCQIPCNSAPTFTNDAVALVCAGTDFVYNLGAIDPDGDSLSYAFGQSLVGPGSNVTYIAPFNAAYPFQYFGAPNNNAALPAGIRIDPYTGDIMFRPMGVFVSQLVIEVTQWKFIGGVWVNVGVSRRDVQFQTKFCNDNRTPLIKVWRDGVLQTGTNTYTVSAGTQICLDIVAEDKEDKTVTPNILADPTDLKWNNPGLYNPAMANATWVSNYILSQRTLTNIPKADSFKFCWVPPLSAARSLPHSFTVTGTDRFCPLPAFSTRGINIKVVIGSSYTINAIAGNNGSISPSGITTVNSNASQRILFTPNAGYKVDSVIVDGIKVDSIVGYTFSNVTSNRNISVTFKCKPSQSTTNLTIPSTSLPYIWNGLTFNGSGSQTKILTNANGCDSSATLNLTVTNTIPSYLPTNGLVGYWPFNGNANDESGNGNHGTVNGATLTTDRNGNSGKAYSFDGISNYIKIPFNSIFNLNNATWNIWVKIKSASTGTGYYIYGMDDLHHHHVTFHEYLGNSGAQIGWAPNSASGIGGQSLGSQWVMLTITYNQSQSSNNFAFYHNGVLQNKSNASPFVFNSGEIRFGGSMNTYWQKLDGMLDDALIYNRILTQQEITQLYTGTLTFNINASSGPNGNISPAGSTSINSGASQTYTFTPNPGYWIDSVIVNGVIVPTASSYTFSNVSSNQSIRVTFTPIIYTISAQTDPNGTISPSGDINIAYGASQRILFTPNIGYMIDSVIVDGIKVDSIVGYTFSNVISNRSIRVTFTPIIYTISTQTTANGTISPSGDINIVYGASQRILFTPNAGFKVDSVIVDGIKVDSIVGYTFSNVTSNRNISVTFKCKPSQSTTNLTIPSTSLPYIWNGLTFNAAGSQTKHLTNAAGCDSTATLNLTVINTALPSYLPANGLVGYWPFNGNANDESGNGFVLNNSFVQFNSDAQRGNVADFNGNSWLHSDTSIFRSRTPITITFWARTAKNYSMDIIGQACGNDCNDDIRVQLNAAQCGYTGLSFKSPSHFATAPGAISDSNWHQFALILGSNFNYSYNNFQFYIDGAFVAIGSNQCGHNWGGWTYNPNANYRLTIGKGGPLGYFFNGKLDDVGIWNRALTATEITAYYNGSSYTINASAGSNGSISPSGITTVNSNASQRILFTPNAGFKVDSVIVDGIKVDSITGYTFNNVTSNRSIRVTFTPIIYTISAQTNANGNISPSGNVITTYGASQRILFTPNPGYMVDSVIVDGIKVDSIGSYTFNNISTNQTIRVTFKISLAKIFFADSLGIIKCVNCIVGDTGTVNGVVYEAVDRTLLDTRKNQGADLTKLCTSLVTDMSSLFENNTFFNQAIGNWDVSKVTNMYHMFYNDSIFNQPLDNWDVSSVTNMGGMFGFANNFNQPIGNWNVSKVADMSWMFANDWVYPIPIKFNQDISSWNVGSVTNMEGMFENATSFNQPIGNWNVSKVTNMGRLFHMCTSFNQALNNWDLSSVINMAGMFARSGFNQPIGNWNVGAVTNMSEMFLNSPFNQPINYWDVSKVKYIGGMFAGNQSFNQPIGNWDVSSVIAMSGMFSNTVFNQPIGNWDVSNVNDIRGMFFNSHFNQNISNWDVSHVTYMDGTFVNCPFNQPIGNWDVSKVTNMDQVFRLATAFNQDISNWNVSKVTRMDLMFQYATNFNQPIGNWDVSSVNNMDNMFEGATAFNQKISNWCVSNITAQPNNFSTNCPITNPNKPIWGTCPYTINASSGANGSITPTGAIIVNSGSNQIFTFTPNSGYMVDSVIVDGIKVDSVSSYTFNNITSNSSIRVTFTPIIYTISTQTDPNGTISPSGDINIAYGASQRILFTPNSGYMIDSVVVDGIKVDSITGYTFNNITSNSSIRVTFKIAQLTVTVTNGSNATPNLASSYPSLASAITDLNAVTAFSGPVTLTCLGTAETAPVGGFRIALTGTTTGTNNVVIDGSSKTVIAANLSATTAGVRNDAIFKIVGSDYVTIQNFTMTENAANTAGGAVGVQKMTEFGVALFASSTTNGAQYNTIKNNTITLSSATKYQNAIGVFSSTASSETNATQAATSEAGTNSFNMIYGNTISGVSTGIYFVSPAQTATVFESGNDIGGTSLSTGNTITYGCSNTASDLGYTSYLGTTPAGVYFRNVVGNSVRYNTITNLPALTLTSGGIFSANGTAPLSVPVYTSNFSNNTITITQTASVAITGIDFGSGTANGTIICDNNKITINHTIIVANSAADNGIKANYTCAGASLSYNTVNINQAITATSSIANSGTHYGIWIPGGTTANITVYGDSVSIIKSANTSATFTATHSGINYGFRTSLAANSMIIGNSTPGNGNVFIINDNPAGAGAYAASYTIYGFHGGGAHNTYKCENNYFGTGNGNSRSSSITYGYSAPSGGNNTMFITNNILSLNKTGVATAGGTTYGIFGGGAATNCSNYRIGNNNLTYNNQTAGTASGNFYGIYTTDQNSMLTKKYHTNNVVSGSGLFTTCVGIYHYYGDNVDSNNTITFTSSSRTTSPSLTGISCINTTPAAYNVFNNTISLTATAGSSSATSPTLTAITMAGTTTANYCHDNIITNLSTGATTGNATVSGIIVSGGVENNVYRNKIYNLSASTTGATTSIAGMRISGGKLVKVYNNLISQTNALTGINNPNAVFGINITSTLALSDIRVYYNTIYLSSTNTGGTNFGATGIFHTSNATGTTANLDLRNNIIVNNITPSGTGLSIAFRRSLVTLNNYATTSNNNLFYCTSGLYADGATIDYTASNMISRVSPREGSSVSETLNFLNTGSPLGANFLMLDPAFATQVESGGLSISGYNDDYLTNGARASYPITGQVYGGGYAPDIGAFEADLYPNNIRIILSQADGNGTIQPSGKILLTTGSSKNFLITPNSGYMIDSVIIDGIKVDSLSSYTFNNITSNGSIRVTFTPIIYTISTQTTANGTISPSGNINIPYGASQRFLFTPNAGYMIDSVIVDGIKVDSIVGYTFNNITSNRNIRVTFKCKPSQSTTNLTIPSTSLPYTWNGLTFNAAGSQTKILTNASGCDSMITLKLTINTQTFTDITTATGLPTNTADWSLISNDFNNDGSVDLIYQTTTNSVWQFFKNTGSGTFLNVTATLGLAIPKTNTALFFVDFDKDGNKDIIYTTQTGAAFNLTFLKNNTNSSYSNVSSLVNCPNNITGGVSTLFDYNNDGNIDILYTVGNATERAIKAIKQRVACGVVYFDSLVYVYNFTATLGSTIYPQVNTIADFDGDGKPDIVFKKHCSNCGLISDGNYYSHLHGILKNNGNGLYSDVTTSSGLGSMPSAGVPWDYNNDGIPDLISGTPDNLSNYSGSKVRVWRGDGNSHFTEQTDVLKLFDGTTKYYGPSVLDIDNDFDLDVFNRLDGYGTTTNQLYLNNGNNLAFTESAATYGLNYGTGFSHNAGVLWLDFDNDGDKDLVSIENSALKVMRNNAFGKNWIKLRLNGCQSNKDAYGIQTILKVGSKKVAAIKGLSDQSELLLGVNTATSIDSISIFWSNSNTTYLTNVNTNQTLLINENNSCPASVATSIAFNTLQDTIRSCGDSVSLNAGAGYTNYSWSNGATSQSITAKQSGWYKVTVTNANGCSATDSSYVSIVKANIINNDTTICKGSTITLSAAVSNAISGNIMPPPSINGFQPGIIVGNHYAYLSTGNNNYSGARNQALALGGDLLCIHSSTEQVQVVNYINQYNASPYIGYYQNTSSPNYSEPSGGWQWYDNTNSYTPAWAPGEPNNIGGEDVGHIYSSGEINDLPANYSNLYLIQIPVNYVAKNSWSTGDSSNAISVTPTTTTKYYLTVNNGISSCIDSVTIVVDSLPVPNLQDTLKVCGDSTLLNPGSFAKYAWSNGDTTATLTAKASGMYKVTVSNAAGCTATDSVYVSLVKAKITASKTRICKGETITLQADTTVGSLLACAKTDLPSNLQTGLVAYYPFCGNANDASGNGNNGTVYGATLTTDRNGNANSAYSFNGINNWIDVASNSILDCTNSLSISVWIKRNNNSDMMVVSRERFLNGTSYLINYTSNGNYGFGVNNEIQSGGCGQACNKGCSTPNTNTTNWDYLTGVWDRSSLKLYINGNLLSTCNGSLASNGGNLLNSAMNLFIGKWMTTNAQLPYYYFNGKIDDIAIYNRALTGSEVQQLYTTSAPQTQTYTWNTGATSNAISVTPTTTTKYYLTVNNGISSCVDSVTIVVDTLKAPNLPNNLNACGDSVLLNPASNGKYLWNTGDTTASIYAKATGIYKVSITNGVCTATDSSYVSLVKAKINASKTRICKGETITLIADSSADVNYNRNYCSTSDIPTQLRSGLIAYYPFCGNVNDISGNGNNGNNNGVTFASNRFGNANTAASFNGGSRIDLPLNLNGSLINLTKASISGYIKVQPGGGGGIFSNWKAFPLTDPFGFFASVFSNKLSSGNCAGTGVNTQSIIPNNNWVHFVAVFDGNNSGALNRLKIYINGVQVQTDSGSLAYSSFTIANNLGNTATHTAIGAWMSQFGWIGYYNGLLDDIGIWNRVLTENEIQALSKVSGFTYNWTNNITGNNNGTSSAISVTPTTTTKYYLTVNNGTSTCIDSVTIVVDSLPVPNLQDTLKVCGDSTILNPGSFTKYAWSNGDTTATITAKASGMYKVTVSNAAGCTATDSVYVSLVKAKITASKTRICKGETITLQADTTVGSLLACAKTDLPTNLQTGLVAYYPFCGNANDASGNGNNGTVNGATLTTDRFGRVNSAYSFNGVNNFIDIGNNFNMTQFSMSAWINVSAFSGQQGIISKLRDWGTYQYKNFHLFVESNNRIGVHIGDGNSYPTAMSNNGVLGFNQWHHILSVFNGSVGNIYLDGILVGTCSNSNYVQTISTSTYIGARVEGGQNFINCFFNGKIDDVGLWNRALTALEVQQLYNSGKPSYTWNTGATSNAISVTPTTTTKYYLTVNNGTSSCIDSVTIVVDSLPVPNLQDTLKVCGDSALLNPGSFAKYAWSNGDTTATLTAKASGMYKVTVSNAAGCTATDSVYVSLVKAKITASKTRICKGETITLQADTTVSSLLACAKTDLPSNLQTGLVAYYPFCGNANDASGNGNNGTVNGATLTTDRFGRANSAYYFPGNISNKIVIPNSNSFNFSSGFTVSAWAYFQQSWNYHAESIIYKAASPFNSGWHIGVDQNNGAYGNGNYTIGVELIGKSSANYCCFPFQNINNWRNCILVYDGNFLKIYVDGVLQASTSSSNAIVNNSLNIEIGGSVNPVSGAYNRSIDDIGIWNRALSNSEIQQLYSGSASQSQTYNWSTINTNLGTDTLLKVTPTTPTKYYLTVNNGTSTCIDSVTIVVDELPVPNLQDTLKVCGDNALLNPGSFAKYAWSNGDTTATLTAKASGMYKVTVSNAAGCTATDSVYVSLVKAKIINNDTTICKNTLVSLSVSTNLNFNTSGVVCATANEGYDAVLNCPNGAIFSQVNFASYGTPNGDCGNFSFGGCNSSNSQSIVESYLLGNTSAIIPAINGIFGDPCWGTYKRLYIQGTYKLPSNLNHIKWSTGDTTNTISVTPNQTTTYYVTVTDGVTNCTDSVTVTVNNFKPNIFVQDTIRVCGNSYNLDAGFGFNSYSWNTGASSQSINVTSTGSYKCTVNNGTCSGVDSVFVSIVDANIVNNDTAICRGTSVLLSNLTANHADLSKMIFLGVKEGHYYYLYDSLVNWEVANQIARNKSGYLYIMNSIEEHHFIYSKVPYKGVDGINYWLGLRQLNTGLDFNEPGGGWYWVDGTPLTINMWENGEPNNANVSSCSGQGEDYAQFEWDDDGMRWNDAPLCPASGYYQLEISYPIIEFDNNPEVMSHDFLWSTGEPTPSITVTPTQTTTYYNTVSNGISNCTDSVTVTVNNFNPNIFVQDTLKVCGTSYTLIADSGYASYIWNTGSTARSLNTTSSGWKNCTVSNGLCFASDSILLSIIDANIINNDSSILAGTTITLRATGTGIISNPLSYVWSTGANTQNINVSPTQKTNYYCTVSNGVSSCADTVKIGVNVKINLKMYFEAFYNNGRLKSSLYNADGISDISLFDTIQIMLYDSINNSVVYSIKSIADTGGNCQILIPSAYANNRYYIGIKHRGSIETWTNSSVLLDNGIFYNFTTSASQAYGANLSNLGNGVFGIYNGDINQDGAVDFNDYPYLDFGNINGDLGYFPTDLNGDGAVDFNDYPIIDINSINGILAITPIL